MELPFSPDQFYDVFVRYNQAVGPVQLLLLALALGAGALLFGSSRARSRAVFLILALLWGWSGIAYHLVFFTSINPAAWPFGALFLAAAACFAWLGLSRSEIRFVIAVGRRSALGGLLIAYALVFYPVIGQLTGHAYPAAPSFGAPCPTTIYSIGVLLFAAPVPRSAFIGPLAWSAIGSSAAFELGVVQDFGLLVAGVAAVVAIALSHRHSTAWVRRST